MRWRHKQAARLAALMLFVPSLLLAQTKSNNPPLIDADAMSALKKMGEYLRTLDKFQVNAQVTTEHVLTDGQKVEFSKHVNLVADRPNKMRIQVDGDLHERWFMYDGKTFTMFAPRLKYYTSLDAPPTILELANKLEDDYDLQLPLVDLFRFGTNDADFPPITAAKNIGPSPCDGLTCQHYAFRQDGMDWQVWIQNGEFPLPRKVVLTTLTDEARPQHTAVYEWNLAPSYNDAAFVFEPPADAKKISIAEAQAQRTVRNN
jgi:hypothetical protein